MAQAWKPPISLDRSLDVPLHEQISYPIQQAIIAGELAPGTLIENELSLAARLRVSRPTARHALQTLVDQGLLLRRRGFGTVVAPKPRHRLQEPSSLFNDIRRAGSVSDTQILRYQKWQADETIARRLECPIGSDVLELERLRLKDGVPVAILYNWLPFQFAPSPDQLLTVGLYQHLQQLGITIASTRQSVGAQRPKRAVARLLGITTRDPILTIERTAFDAEGKIVEWGYHSYRGDRYQYESTVFSELPAS
ncbi:GntR family transcriptional regulator [Arcanobacterium bovis]|uniref:GntR family transcriptional regulator n=1 Tax=Arcanobacterium bovis TaxID=2529275 RepID=A0A4Q9UZC4_9ACTO|nr:GntR family transcriptional regulator [Arcanobacterium bovis]TBW21093.1 GntR family transcriptional regulator [Arcanobacterium bovis]